MVTGQEGTLSKIVLSHLISLSQTHQGYPVSHRCELKKIINKKFTNSNDFGIQPIYQNTYIKG